MKSKNNRPLIGVCLINFHQKQLTLQCLESLQKQTYPNFKLYLLDNETKGEFTKEELNKYEGLNYVASLENTGFAKGNNILIKKALSDKCDFIVMLNNDTVTEHDLLENLLIPYQTIENVGASSCIITYYKQPNKVWFAGGILHPFLLTQHKYMNNDLRLLKMPEKVSRVDWITGCCFMVPASVVKKVGLLDEIFFSYLEDVDYSLRIRQINLSLQVVKKPLVKHVISPAIGKQGSNTFTDAKLTLQLKNSKYLIGKHARQLIRLKQSINCLLQLTIYLVQKRVSPKQYLTFLKIC